MKAGRTALWAISKIAKETARTEVNSACICIGYQPRVPEAAQKLNKKTSR